MKTIIFSTLMAGILAISARPVAAQAANDGSMNKEPGISELLFGVYSNDIPARAYKHFKKTFAGITGEQWSVTASGFMTRFTINGAVSRAFYDIKGNWLLTIACYGESKLPPDTRAALKSVYPDYTILTVEEIQMPERTIYQADIVCNKNWKTVRIYDGEMEVVNDFVNL
jgi:hypothetical protein